MEAADGAAVRAGAAIKPQQQPESKQEEEAGDHVAVDGVKVPPHPAPAAAPQPTPAAIKVQQPEPKQEVAPGDTGDDVKVPTHPAPAAAPQRAPAAQTAKLAPVVENQKPLSQAQASPSSAPTPAAYQHAAMEEQLRDLDGHDVRVEGGWHAGAAVGGHGLAPAHLQERVLRLKEMPESQPSSSPAPAAGAAATAYQRIPVVDDDEQLSPAATACHKVTMNCLLCALTVIILGVILVADLGLRPAKWAGKITAKTSKDWLLGGFVAVGSVTSLLLSYSRLTIYVAVWREGTAGSVARVVPSVASLLNCLVWVCYGFFLHPANVAMIVVNLTGAAFHIGYVSVYVFYSDTRNRILVVIMLVLAAGAGGAIAAIDLHGMELPEAVGSSAVATACVMYGVPLIVLLCLLWIGGTTAAVPNWLVLGATFLNALVWFVDGFVVRNVRLQVPHGVGVLSCLIQVAIYLCCNKINSTKAPRSTRSSTSTSPLDERLLENV